MTLQVFGTMAFNLFNMGDSSTMWCRTVSQGWVVSYCGQCATAEIVICTLKDLIFDVGVPVMLVSDFGPQFKLWKFAFSHFATEPPLLHVLLKVFSQCVCSALWEGMVLTHFFASKLCANQFTECFCANQFTECFCANQFTECFCAQHKQEQALSG